MHLNDTELYLFNTGANAYSYRALGCHGFLDGGQRCFRFAVWAPNARYVNVVGDFNGWDCTKGVMSRCGTTGVWEAVLYDVKLGDCYKFAILTQSGELIFKADPFAFYSQARPETASVVADIGGYAWGDSDYMEQRAVKDHVRLPVSIYEVHAGSWREGMSYRKLAEELIPYVKEMGYTHIEFMPLAEHPLDDSWGYQVTGFYSPTSRYGSPHDLMYLVDSCHREGIGVILDWVGGHFPRDAHGLREFDGTPIFEHPDRRRSEQKQWGTLLFNYAKSEVRSFLISNAVFWLNEYHFDGLRADAVSCMLYLDYGREAGEWISNQYGGRENLDAIHFLGELSETVSRECRGALLIAEESTSFPKVTEKPPEGGLGFDFKWNMGFMNDTLSYMSMDSVYRKWHHDKLTFPMVYAFAERFILPFSHDEMVHGKHSLIGRMNGTYDERFAQLRLLYAYQYTHPGKKLLFMGGEFAQFIEWDFRKPLDWFLLDYPRHMEMQSFVKALNELYSSTPALYGCDTGWDGFEWVSVDDRERGIIAYIRTGLDDGERVMCVLNFTALPAESYRLRLNKPAGFTRLLSTSEERFGGWDREQDRTVLSSMDEFGCFVDISIGGYEGAVWRMDIDGGTYAAKSR
ncbi:MAG: 1,4-alpha-glucan branching protein GlgB [Candidatus Gastranaerophilaceae bacterium]|nr:1,4-alpha-glucan branching protein GlgB [Christensenellales bacterium]